MSCNEEWGISGSHKADSLKPGFRDAASVVSARLGAWMERDTILRAWVLWSAIGKAGLGHTCVESRFDGLDICPSDGLFGDGLVVPNPSRMQSSSRCHADPPDSSTVDCQLEPKELTWLLRRFTPNKCNFSLGMLVPNSDTISVGLDNSKSCNVGQAVEIHH